MIKDIHVRAGQYSMTKIVHQSIFQNYTGFMVFDGIFHFMHDWGLTTLSIDWEKIYCILTKTYPMVMTCVWH